MGQLGTLFSGGALHGLGQVVEGLIVPEKFLKKRSHGGIGFLRTFIVFIFVSYAWIYFASYSVPTANNMIDSMLTINNSPVDYLRLGFQAMGFGVPDLIYLLVSITLLTLWDYLSLKQDVITSISSLQKHTRWIIYTFFVLWVIMNVPIAKSTEFIYFQF